MSQMNSLQQGTDFSRCPHLHFITRICKHWKKIYKLVAAMEKHSCSRIIPYLKTFCEIKHKLQTFTELNDFPNQQNIRYN